MADTSSAPPQAAPPAAAPKVTVVSAFYNRARALAATVDCLLGQTLREIEVIVVDDGSIDGTAELLRGYDDPRLRPLIQPNSGFVTAMNRAIAMGRGRYVAVHGSGDISYPERLERQAAYLDANPEVGAVGCTRKAGPLIVGPKDAVERGPMLKRMLWKNAFTHGEVMFRRDLFDAVGGYREIFKFAQDRDLWLRMARSGCDYAVLPELLYEREYFPDGVSKTPRSLFLQTKLSAFAVQNATQLDAKGRDLIDRFGPSAFFLTKPVRKLARDYTLWGLRALRDGDLVGAEVFLPAGWREWRMPYTLAGILAWRLSASPVLARPIRVMLRAGTPKRDGEEL